MRTVDLYAIVQAVRSTTATKRRRFSGTVPVPESLECRQLLSFLDPYGAKFARVQSGGVVDVISVAGPGQVFTEPVNRTMIAISLVGTTQDSQVTIASLGARLAGANHPLQIEKIVVRSGRLGSFQGLTTANLDGKMTPLLGPVASLQFDAIGPAAQITVNGNLGQLSVNRGIDLGPTGQISVSNDLTGSLSITRDLTLAGGQINIGRDLTGTVSIGGNLSASNGGQFSVGRNLGATATGAAADTIAGNLSVDSDSKFSIRGNLSALTVGGNLEASGSGEISVTGNLGTLTVSGGGGASATGNVTLRSGGELLVGQNLSSLSVGSNIVTSTGGTIQVAGDLGTLSVAGDVQGDGSKDIVVGDDLGQLTVLGGASGGSLQDVGINVAKNIQGLDIRNGIFNSLIEAGILINGGTPGTGSNGWNIGPDGPIAVMDSEILAGFEIENITIGGDVKSDLPSNSAGSTTRIVAGEYPEGTYLPGGTIDKFQITGQLIDAVLAASVEPDNGFYPQPAGTIEVGFTPTPPAPPTTIPNYTAPPFEDSSVPADLVLAGGSINPSFIPTPLSPTTTPGTVVPIPSTSTVLGGVVTSPHVNNADFAGIFAADTRGVIVGPLPPILPPNG
ncbi:MAG: hypothetical protein ACLQIB_21370 [Isosphaeraceae bacterium]